MPTTAGDNMERADRVDAVKMLPRSPNPGDAGSVVDDVHALARRSDHLRVTEIAPQDFDSQRAQLGIITAGQRSHAIATGNQLFDDVSPQESTATSDKCIHGKGFRVEGSK
tara:strand:+ start:961 stop:1293 length:333 start_codon:yes stop_codon:yes gene_type:complete